MRYVQIKKYVIYFCPDWVNFICSRTLNFLFFVLFCLFFLGGEGGRLLHLPLARVPMYEAVLIFNYNM